MVVDGSCTLCSSFSTLMDCAIVMLGRLKMLLGLSLVMIKGPPCSPDIDVAPVSMIADGIITFRTPILIYVLVRW